MSVTDQTFEALRGCILSGEYAPGERLPAEAELAKRFGVGRNSVREAVRALSHTQLLTVRRGDGTYVSSLAPNELLAGIGLAASLARDDAVIEVVEVRRMLEPESTALATPNASPQLFERLEKTLDRMADSLGDYPRFMEADVEFHQAIAEASGNSWLAAILGGLAQPTIVARRRRVERHEEVGNLTLIQHGNIVQAMRTGDPETARAYAFVHVSSTLTDLKRLLAAEQSASAVTEEQLEQKTQSMGEHR